MQFGHFLTISSLLVILSSFSSAFDGHASTADKVNNDKVHGDIVMKRTMSRWDRLTKFFPNVRGPALDDDAGTFSPAAHAEDEEAFDALVEILKRDPNRWDRLSKYYPGTMGPSPAQDIFDSEFRPFGDGDGTSMDDLTAEEEVALLSEFGALLKRDPNRWDRLSKYNPGTMGPSNDGGSDIDDDKIPLGDAGQFGG